MYILNFPYKISNVYKNVLRFFYVLDGNTLPSRQRTTCDFLNFRVVFFYNFLLKITWRKISVYNENVLSILYTFNFCHNRRPGLIKIWLNPYYSGYIFLLFNTLHIIKLEFFYQDY